ncbi:hypothetical protein [Salibacterium halotolerans]|uniref:ABC-2 type transport system permease protein n=1 Tax=Salibacterium halotolerans TaxID=1884432 RepID=A0A1I5S2C0_9BACI|nr:hypothetical protein [Salibacterium halotolerans]SFP64855.1 hypothetical protein SAMN05518683_10821 [Salibacterium halotolerans]
MQDWGNLLKKELRLGLPAFWIVVGALLFIGGVASYIGGRNEVLNETLFIFSGVAFLLMSLYLSFYFIFSMTAETKRLHLWLHHKRSAVSLLLAKMTSGVIYQVIVMAFLVVIAFVTVTQVQWNAIPNGWNLAVSAAAFLSIHIVLYSIYTSMALLFFWMVFLLMKKVMPTIVSVCFTVIIAIAALSAFGWLGGTAFYAAISEWGSINMENLFFWVNFSFLQIETPVIYIGSYVLDILLTVVLFILSAWILDRKVEV